MKVDFFANAKKSLNLYKLAMFRFSETSYKKFN